jgi:hypothetical protein
MSTGSTRTHHRRVAVKMGKPKSKKPRKPRAGKVRKMTIRF